MAKRIDELVATITEILDTGTLSAQKAFSLRGRMQFAHAQLWGRSSKLCLNAVTRHAYTRTGDAVGVEIENFLRLCVSCLRTSKPPDVPTSWDLPYLIFTDASFNPEDPHWPPCEVKKVKKKNVRMMMSRWILRTDLAGANE